MQIQMESYEFSIVLAAARFDTMLYDPEGHRKGRSRVNSSYPVRRQLDHSVTSFLLNPLLYVYVRSPRPENTLSRCLLRSYRNLFSIWEECN